MIAPNREERLSLLGAAYTQAFIDNDLAKLVGDKVRVVGRFLTYDHRTVLGLVLDRGTGLLVDLQLCVDPWGKADWLRQSRGQVMITGELEFVSTPLELPEIPQYVDVDSIDSSLVLRAMSIVAVPDLDMNLWRTAIIARKEFERSKASKLHNASE